MGPTNARPERRSVLLLGVGAGAVLLSGCTVNNPFSTEKTPAATAVRDLAPDVGVAVQAVALISAAQSELETLIAGRATNAAGLAGLAAAYRAYAEALSGAVPKGVEITRPASSTPAPSTPPPVTGADVQAAARRTATTLHDRLTGFALRAESGAFARLLGSMAAGLSQQVAVLAR